MVIRVFKDECASDGELRILRKLRRRGERVTTGIIGPRIGNASTRLIQNNRVAPRRIQRHALRRPEIRRTVENAVAGANGFAAVTARIIDQTETRREQLVLRRCCRLPVPAGIARKCQPGRRIDEDSAFFLLVESLS